MDLALLVVLLVTSVVVGVGLVYTYRWFTAGDEAPAPTEQNGHHLISPHDHATTALLKAFFDGKACAICDRPIGPVHRTGRKPGLFNPTTHVTHSWDEIPHQNLAAVLETELPVCSACQVAESFRDRFPDRVLDRDRSSQHAPVQQRASAGS